MELFKAKILSALDESAAVTLMATDVQTICDALAQVHEVWASLIEVVLALWLLEAQMGLATLGPFVVAVSVVLGVFILSTYMSRAQKAWMEGIQTRIDVTSKMLEAMKGVKMLGLTTKLRDIIFTLRRNEIGLSIKIRKLMVLSVTLGNSADFFAPCAALSIFVIVAKYNGQTLDVSSAFTALSIISLLTAPIGTLIFSFPPLIASIACFGRIQTFMNSASREDHRILEDGAHGKRRNHTLVPSPVSSNRDNQQDIEMMSIAFTQGPASSPAAAIRVRNASFAWGMTKIPVVKDVSFDIAHYTLTMIVGPVGSGKSSLLKGLLGETPSCKGFVYVKTLRAAFVDQTCWIQHNSFRENILGMALYDEIWYATVVHACALEEDIAGLPKGDRTTVGSAGISLSGGQKQRLVISDS